MALLEVDQVVKRYGKLVANDGVSLAVQAGQVFGLLGPNGAGKTTLVRQVLGLTRPDAGSIRVEGQSVGAATRARCSFQPQTAMAIEGLSAYHAVRLTARLRGLGKTAARARCAELFSALEMNAWADKRITATSGGVARLVMFCMATVAPGALVVLDEPTNDVDPLRRKTLWLLTRQLADAGAGVLLVTHNVAEAEHSVDELAVMDAGRIVASGSPADLKGPSPELRLTLSVRPGRDLPESPGSLGTFAVSGTRWVAVVSPTGAAKALAWAEGLRAGGAIEEFSLGPTTLEDAYVRAVSTSPIGAEDVAA